MPRITYPRYIGTKATPQLESALTALATRWQITVSSIVRVAIEEFLARAEHAEVVPPPSRRRPASRV
jgi:hypothetical protein